MTRTLIGIDYTGTACIKITKGDFDPVSTLDAETYKFLYSSKWAADYKIAAYGYPVPQNDLRYVPSLTQWDYFCGVYNNAGTISYGRMFHRSYFPGLLYDFPLWDKPSKDVSGYFIQRKAFRTTIGNASGSPTTVYSVNVSLYRNNWVGSGSKWPIVVGNQNNNRIETVTLQQAGTESGDLVIWNLPADNTAIQNGTPQTPVAGQPQIIITPGILKVSKPGYDVNTASGSQLAFDSSNLPAKVILAADIAVPNGTSYYPCGFTLPADIYIDAVFYPPNTNVVTFPCAPDRAPYSVRYRPNGTNIEFVNDDGACRARFLLYASTPQSQSTGTNNVLQQFADSSGQNVVQFLKPGASATPTFQDIVIDSRWPVPKILAEGYFTVGTGPQAQTVTFDATGYMVFVKFNTIHNAGNKDGYSWTKMSREPQFTYYIFNGQALLGGNTCYVAYNTQSATFYSNANVPYLRYYTRDGAGRLSEQQEWDPAPMIGIRYYVFGIPV